MNNNVKKTRSMNLLVFLVIHLMKNFLKLTINNILFYLIIVNTFSKILFILQLFLIPSLSYYLLEIVILLISTPNSFETIF